MFSEIRTRCERAVLLPVIAAVLAGAFANAQTIEQSSTPRFHTAAEPLKWESPARLHRAAFIPGGHGTLLIDGAGVEFRAGDGSSQRWTIGEIHTIYIAPHRLVLESYVNRRLHLPGERTYRFSVTRSVPPAVAAAIAGAVGRPSRNADPDPKTAAIAVIPVRHRGLASGTNGVLRFRRGGIDYVTGKRGDSRSWRWADLETLSDPDPWHLFIFGYRDTYTFDLKAPLSRELFDWATDQIAAQADNSPLDESAIPVDRNAGDIRNGGRR